MFNQLQLSADRISAQSALTLQAMAGIATERPDAARYAALVIATRLREHPRAYLEFGPYWWAVKDVLRAAGQDFGEAADPLVQAAYGAGLDAFDTLVAGELFKDYYRSTYLAGAAQFWLDDAAEESYVLFDADMEARRLGPGALRVAANLEARRQPDDPENAY